MPIITLQSFLVHLKAFHRICLVYCGLLSCPENGVLGFLLTLDSVEVHAVSVRQSLSCVQLFSISWDAACQVSLSITNSRSLLKLIFILSVMPLNNFIFCLPLCLLPLIFPCIKSFLMSQFFPSGGQSIGGSASASILPMNIQDLSLTWTGWLSLQSKGLSRVLSNATV